MALPCYKLNNSYTVYVNYYYLNDCISAGKAYAKKKKEIAVFQQKVLTSLHSPKVITPTQAKVIPLKAHTLVRHKQFGIGKVISTDDNGIIRVAFGTDIRRFLYPDAVHQGHLSIISK